MSALDVWRDEVARGERTIWKRDILADAAAREMADEEFERETLEPQRLYLAQLKLRGKKKRAPRPAKWERDATRMMVGIDDGA